MKPYDFVQTNDYYQVKIVTRNHTIVFELLVSDRNSGNHV